VNLARFIELPEEARVATIRDDARGATAALVALGDECERLAAGSPADAIAHGGAIARCARTLALGSAVARALRATIPAIAYQGRLDDAIAAADEAAREASAAGDAIEAARARVASMHALAKLGRTDEALATGRSARDALAGAGRADLAARAELNLANIHKIRGETGDSLAALERALAGIHADDSTARGVTLNSLGETLLQLDRFDEAERAFRDAEALLAAQPFARAVVAGNLADLLAREGRVGEALRVFDAASHATKDAAPGHHARLEIDRAEALLAIGAFAEALDATDRALAVAVSKGLASETVRGLSVRARAYLAAGRRDEAAGAVDDARRRALAIGDRRADRAAALVASEIALVAGDADAALRFACEARETAASDASPLDVAIARTRAARAHLVAGAHDEALRESTAAIAAAASLDVATVELDATLVAADAERAVSGIERSIARLARAVTIAESTRATLAADRHRAAYAALSLRAYEDLALDLLARGDAGSLARAFDITERARSRTLLETMLRAIDRTAGSRAGDRATGSEAAASDELAALRARLSVLHAAGPRSGGTDLGNDFAGERRGTHPNAQLDAMHATERAIDDVVARLENSRGLGALLASPVELPTVVGRLAPDDALISYFASGDELLAFTVAKGRLRCVRSVAPMSEVATLVEKLLYLLRAGAREVECTRDARPIEALARALASAILAPILADEPEIRRARRIVVIPCGPLHALPFGLLDPGDGPLLLHHEIQVAPSASIACAEVPAESRESPRESSCTTSCKASCTSSRTAPHASPRTAVVAFADGAAPLIAEEAERIAALHGVEACAGEHATRAALARMVLGADTVHLACHGRFVPSLPAASGLRLADGWLPLRDIVALPLDADLVFLSGCETGRHAVDAAEELTGLARAFHAAGARRLVTTLWPVRDRAALAVATGFHEALRRGMRPSAALRDAVLAFRRDTPHPSWWAPFVVSGVL
jgi:CHAT domain-containing protein/tetratricopeptide (TPR) repeat protein